MSSFIDVNFFTLNYRKRGHDKLIRVDYHGKKEVPTGTCHAILKAAGIKH